MSAPTAAAMRAATAISEHGRALAHSAHGPTCAACLERAEMIDRETGLPELLEALQRFIALHDLEYLGPDPRAAHAVKLARAVITKSEVRP